MSTPLLQQFPALASQPASFLKDLLSSPELVEAFLFTLPEVQQLAADIERIGKENEELASEYAQSDQGGQLLPRVQGGVWTDTVQRVIWHSKTSCWRCAKLQLNRMAMRKL